MSTLLYIFHAHQMEWWREALSRPQDPCSTLQDGIQGEFLFYFIFYFFVGKFVDFILHWEFGVETLSFCYCLLLLKFWTLHGWSCCNLGFGDIFELLSFLAWCNLDNVGDSWNLAMYVTCGVVEGILAWIFRDNEVMKNLLYRLGRTNSFLTDVENLL